jgi:hypothetical protein
MKGHELRPYPLIEIIQNNMVNIKKQKPIAPIKRFFSLAVASLMASYITTGAKNK